jgi:hypothetical protein
LSERFHASCSKLSSNTTQVPSTRGMIVSATRKAHAVGSPSTPGTTSGRWHRSLRFVGPGTECQRRGKHCKASTVMLRHVGMRCQR